MTKMTFGRYGPKYFPPDGVSLEFIPSWYFKWMLKQDSIIMTEKYEELIVAVEKEMAQREKYDLHFDNDTVKSPKWA